MQFILILSNSSLQITTELILNNVILIVNKYNSYEATSNKVRRWYLCGHKTIYIVNPIKNLRNKRIQIYEHLLHFIIIY